MPMEKLTESGSNGLKNIVQKMVDANQELGASIPGVVHRRSLSKSFLHCVKLIGVHCQRC